MMLEDEEISYRSIQGAAKLLISCQTSQLKRQNYELHMLSVLTENRQQFSGNQHEELQNLRSQYEDIFG